jgi:hypothetical protein
MTVSVKTIPTLGELGPGTYYIGDPCYLIRDSDDWKDFLALLWAAEQLTDENGKTGLETGVIFDWKGARCFVTATNCGDGCYRDQYGAQYPVDAGMIAVVKTRGFGINFRKNFAVGCDVGRWRKGRKRIKIGHIRIDT